MMARACKFTPFVVVVGCKYFSLVLAIFLFSCSPNSKLKRANRLIAEAVAAGATVKTDTVYVERRIIIPSITHDTVLQVVNFSDTITIETERVKTRIRVDTVSNTVFVQQQTKADTIFIEVPVSAPTQIKTGHGTMVIVVSSLLGIFLGFVLGYFFKPGSR